MANNTEAALLEREQITEEDERAARIAEKNLAMRNMLRAHVQDMLEAAAADKNSAMSGKDANDYVKGMSEKALEDAKDDATKMEWLKETARHVHSFTHETKQWGERIMKAVNSAKDGMQSTASIERWQMKMKERKGETWDQMKRKLQDFLKTELPELKANWKELKTKLKAVKDLQARTGIQTKDVKELAYLESEAFANAKYQAQKKSIAAAYKALQAHDKDLGALHEEVSDYLIGATGAGYLSSKKVTPWLKNTFDGKSPAQAKAFFQAVVKPTMKRSETAKSTFDDLSTQLREHGTPRGFSLVSKEAFLAKSVGAREAYNAMGKLRLKEMHTRSSALKGYIHSAFDTEDWRDAARLISQLKVASPDDDDIATLENYLRTHRSEESTAEEPKRTPAEISEDLHTRIQKYPTMNTLLQKTIEGDTNAIQDEDANQTRMVGRMIFNAEVWSVQNGYLDEEKKAVDKKNAENKEKTGEYIDEGHTQDEVENNIIGGATAEEEGIRKDSEKAQNIYMDADPKAQHAVSEYVEKQKNNPKDGYWNNLITEEPRAKILEFINVDSPKIKQGIWELREQGAQFSVHSSSQEESQEKSIPATEKVPQLDKAEIQAGMSV